MFTLLTLLLLLGSVISENYLNYNFNDPDNRLKISSSLSQDYIQSGSEYLEIDAYRVILSSLDSDLSTPILDDVYSIRVAFHVSKSYIGNGQ